MQVAIVDMLQAFEALRERWNALAEAATHASIFSTWMWQWYWWRHYGGAHALRILVVEDAGELVGLVPLYIQRVSPFPGLPVGMLRFMGTGGDTSPDDLDALIRPGYEAQVAPLLAHHLVHKLGGWDIAHVTDMHADSEFRAALRTAFGQARLEMEESVSARIAYASLPQTWDEYLAAMHRDRRYTVRNTRRKFEGQPGARFFLWDDAATMDAAVDRLIALHHLRWQRKGEEHAFSSPEYMHFHRDVIRACHQQGHLRMYCMEADGAVMAMYYCYRFRDAVYYFQGGFDQHYERLRPGLCLMGYAIEHAITEGNRVFDMLRGDYDYKRQWAKETRETHQVLAYQCTARALAFRMRYSHMPRIKRGIKQAVSSVRAVARRRTAETVEV